MTICLFAAGVVVPLLISGGQAYPRPADGAGSVSAYLASSEAAVRFAALFQFAAAVPLAVFTAAVVARLQVLGVRAAGPMIALAGGLVASTAMAVAACGLWVMSRLPATTEPALLLALRDLVFVAGGPWHVVALGLLLAGIAVSAAFHRLLPRPIWVAGVALAIACELATLALVIPQMAYLVPVGRFGGLLWLLVVSVRLPQSRASSRVSAARSTAAAVSSQSAR